MGYMIVDTFLALRLKNGLILLHHALTLAAMAAFCFEWYPLRDLQFLPTGLFIATELSTPFLHAVYLLRKARELPPQSSTVAALTAPAQVPPSFTEQAAATGTLLSWIVLRLMTFFYFFWRVWAAREQLLAELARSETDSASSLLRICSGGVPSLAPWLCAPGSPLAAVHVSGGALMYTHTMVFLVALFLLNIFWFQKLVALAFGSGPRPKLE